MPDPIAPFDWFATPHNYQGLSLAYGATIMAAGGAANLNGAVWSTALLGLVSAVMFTTITIPLLAIYWGLQWPWWSAVGAGWGLVSVIAMRSIIKGALRVENRTNDIVDGGLKRVLPGTPGDKS